MAKRLSVPSWKEPALQAAAMRVGVCTEAIGLVGIDMVARDGNTFAHGHFDLDVAEKFRADLDIAIAEAKRRAAN